MNDADRGLAQLLEPTEPSPGCPTDWTLQRYAVEELLGVERDEVATHVAACAGCRERVRALDRQREAFLAARPWGSIEAEINERALFLPDEPEVHVATPLWPRLRLALVGFAGVVASLALALVVLPMVDGGTVEPTHRLKGDTGLSATRLRGGELAALAAGDAVLPGDRLQFSVDPGTYDHVVVVGVDGAGAVAVHQPLRGELSVPVEPGAGRLLDGGVELDEAPGPEVFVAIFTDEPVAVRDARRAVERWAGNRGADGVIAAAPERALGGAVEVLALSKEVPTP